MMPEPSRTDDMASVLFFLAGAVKEGLMLNGHQAKDAYDAAFRLIGFKDPEKAKADFERCI